MRTRTSIRIKARLLAVLALAAGLAASSLGMAAPAQAATADRWGYALVDNPVVPIWAGLNPARNWVTTGVPSAQGGKIATGRFMVKFPGIGTPGNKGVAHVTTVDRNGNYCEVVKWFQSGLDELVDVACFKPGGIAADTAFSVLFTVSSGVLGVPPGSHAYAQYGTVSLVQAYNSTGGAVVVAPIGAGQYQVRLNGVLGTAGVLAGNVQATAIQPNLAPRRCKIYKWYPSGLDVIAHVFCFNQAGALTNTEFNLSYHRERSVTGSFAPPKYIGYLDTISGGQTNFNYVMGGFGFNSFGPSVPVGRYTVKYPQLGVKETHAQITAHGAGSNYCNLTQNWLHSGPDAIVDVICFDNTGASATHNFLSTFTSRV
ncbi:hypothetical protein [Longispora albida]|uniref:hypothetical protein n=1 Tax=Longispora albida TaxID=203523 RepID=UPI0003A49CCF|nr:hypothetical protein [Longispora albida]